MLYMVIEHFKDAKAVYDRFEKCGRMLPEGLRYINSWTESNFARCFQVMECDDPSIFNQWTVHWDDLIDFEIVPVMTGAQAADKIKA
jgi:hypothetical protein